ncbi:response regulator transcription factor [Deinococcus yavapaiensis]|nr:response regulator transcription factor [Deinococcus yavapaiensis]
MPKCILIIEDDPDVRDVLTFTLREAGYDVIGASTAEDGLTFARSHHVDLVLLDLGLPDRSGATVADALHQEQAHIKIIVLSAYDDTDHKVHLLRLGAHDYITKPVETRELLARVHVQLRRKGAITVRAGPLVLNVDAREARWDAEMLTLNNKEFDLLALLAAAPGRVFRLDELMQALWPFEEVHPNLVSVHVLHLRRKLEAVGASGVIRTVRGLGYGLDPRSSDSTSSFQA